MRRMSVSRFVMMAAVTFGVGGSLAWAQGASEVSASAIGSSIGSVAGKQVGQGVDKILKGTGSLLEAAAATGEPAEGKALLEIGAGEPAQQPEQPDAAGLSPAGNPAPRFPSFSSIESGSVGARSAVSQPLAEAATPAPPVPPPPTMTAASLSEVVSGMDRQQLLDLGAPASRISMSQGGHLVEVYRYMDRDTTLGSVRLSDGEVTRVDTNR